MALRILDASKLDKVPMQGIVLHWPASGYNANGPSKRSYHLIIEGDGAVVYAVPIRANSAPLSNGYAAHTRGANTGRIGLALASMWNATESPFDAGPYPLLQVQWDRAIIAAADLCEFYGIPSTRETLLSHAEVQSTLGITQSGKWDIARLAFAPEFRGAHIIGDMFRQAVNDLLGGALPASTPAPAILDEPGLTIYGQVTAARLNFRRGPSTIHEIVGSLPRGTPVQILSQSNPWFQVKSPAGFIGWVHGGYVKIIGPPDGVEQEATPDLARPVIGEIRAELDRIESELPLRDGDFSRLETVLAHLRNTMGD